MTRPKIFTHCNFLYPAWKMTIHYFWTSHNVQYLTSWPICSCYDLLHHWLKMLTLWLGSLDTLSSVYKHRILSPFCTNEIYMLIKYWKLWRDSYLCIYHILYYLGGISAIDPYQLWSSTATDTTHMPSLSFTQYILLFFLSEVINNYQHSQY